MRSAWTGAAILVICVSVFIIGLADAERSRPGVGGQRQAGLATVLEAPDPWARPAGSTSPRGPVLGIVARRPEPQLAAFPILSLPEPFAQLTMLAILGAIAWGLRTL